MNDISGLAAGAPIEHHDNYCSNLFNIPGKPDYDKKKIFYCRITGSECLAYSFIKKDNTISPSKSYIHESAQNCPGYDKIPKHRIVLWRITHDIKKHQVKIAKALMSELEAQIETLEKQQRLKKK